MLQVAYNDRSRYLVFVIIVIINFQFLSLIKMVRAIFLFKTTQACYTFPVKYKLTPFSKTLQG